MIDVIGLGLAGASDLAFVPLKKIAEATVLVGGDRHLSYFPHHPAEKIRWHNWSEVLGTLQQRLEASEKIVILASGDPLFFGIGRLLLAHFAASDLTFHPHLSCAQLMFNRLKVPWQGATFVSVHGRSLELLLAPLQKGTSPLAILTDAQHHPGAIAAFYLSLDVPTAYEFWIGENLGSPEAENIYSAAPETLVKKTSQDFAPLNVLVLIRRPDAALPLPAHLPRFGIADRHFLGFGDRPGLMTKREIRIQILGQLDLQEPQVIWDIGAGTGSVAIEIARLCPTSRIYALEKTALGVALIKENSQRFGVENINIKHLEAPQGLETLPTPERIFIGGSGGNLPAILKSCHQLLAPQGKILLTLATLENLATCITILKEQGWPYSLQQLQVSRSLPLGELTRLEPLNPVTLILIHKPI